MANPNDAAGQALALLRKGRLLEAWGILQQALSASPDDAELLHLLGVLELQSGAHAKAIAWLRQCVERAPGVAIAWSNLGVAYNAAGDFANALPCHEKTLALDPGNPTALKNLGIALRYLRRYDESLASFRRAAQRAPDDPDLLREWADLLVDTNRLPEAIARYDRALALRPGDPATHHNRGFALYRSGERERAAEEYRSAVGHDPRFARAWSSLGVVLNDLGRHAEALECHEKAIALEPGSAEFHSNRGIALDDLGREAEALASYDRALALDPAYAEAWSNRGAVLSDLRRYDEALAAYERAFVLKPGMDFDAGHRLHLKMHLCDWGGLDALAGSICAALDAGQPASQPFPLVHIRSSPAQQLRSARLYADHLLRACPPQPWPRPPYAHERIRVGYFSADFRNHPVAYLVAGLIERHDRARFEVTAFSFGPDTGDATRKRLEGAFDRFVDVRDKTDAQVAEVARNLEIDIAVDVMGYTQLSRTAIFAHRAAPIQAQYLGYPGTMGTTCIDYLIADATVIPDEHLAHYSEKIVFLPGSYQVNDAARGIAADAPPRSALDLPDDGFVFCCFNNKVKVTPDVFDAWMRILQAVPGSVLWLVEGGDTAMTNLRAEAKRRGVAPERLVFARRVALPDHLARLRHADLALDTFHYNGHATTSDTLLAGVPVLTVAGNAFAGRVAASLLGAAGLPELVATSSEAYEALAVELATQPERLRAIRGRLDVSRHSASLFDVERFARQLEAAYERMVAGQRAGLAPEHIR